MAKFTLKKSRIKVTDEEGNGFDVRGLSLNDIRQLIDLHNPIMEQMFRRFADRDASALTNDEIADSASQVAVAMLEQAPALVAHAIVLAADDIENLAEYADLPVGVQIDALTEIGRLTFETAGGSKKLLDLVKSLLLANPRSNPGLSPLTSGSGA